MKLAVCHPNRKSQARGLCKNCYDKWLKKENPAYRERQLSNTTKWFRNNPDKAKAIIERRRLKQGGDPLYKQKRREQMLRAKYGLSLSDYDELLKKQGGGCAICTRKPGRIPHHVDHCHVTGRVRGILCHQCNWYLGTLEMDPKVFGRLIDYYERARVWVAEQN